MPLDIYGGYILPKTDFCISFCFLALENSRHFGTPPLVSSRNDVWETSAELPLMTCYYPELISASDWSCGVGHFFSTNRKHYADLGRDASPVWNFCARFSDIISRGNQ